MCGGNKAHRRLQFANKNIHHHNLNDQQVADIVAYINDLAAVTPGG